MFIDSVLQSNSDYSLAGSNITISPAPVSNSAIEVIIIGDSGPQGPQGPGGTGPQGPQGPSGATGPTGPGGTGTGNPGSTRDIFTGDGSTSTFTLTVPPTSEAHTLVFVGTVLQGNAQYNISGSNVVFTTAPPSNTQIDVYTIGDSGPQGPQGPSGPSGVPIQYLSNTTNTAIQIIDSWSANTYRSGKYYMQVESGTGYLATEIMIIHDDSVTNLLQYGTVSFESTNVGVFTSDISSGNVRLLFTPTDDTSFVTYNRVLLSKRSSESLPTDLMSGNASYDLLVTLPFHPIDLN
ncbi:MAG: hypothetical protein FJ187_06360 [Gammaproteobacteria bacterium]|nr:hypothetical protein [Gammaproteobacteria bacterium]